MATGTESQETLRLSLADSGEIDERPNLSVLRGQLRELEEECSVLLDAPYVGQSATRTKLMLIQGGKDA